MHQPGSQQDTAPGRWNIEYELRLCMCLLIGPAEEGLPEEASRPIGHLLGFHSGKQALGLILTLCSGLRWGVIILASKMWM